MSDTPNTPRTGAGNTNKPLRSRSWFFTLNNFTPEDITFFSDTLNTEKYAFQHEVGESGTHHLQGVVYFESARTFAQMKQLHSKAHWEKTLCLKGAIGYCCDIKKRAVPSDIWVKGWTLPKQLKLITDLYPWQQKIVDLVNTEADERIVYWFWEQKGNVGKTALQKYLLNKYPRTHFFSGGKANDIAFQVIKNKWEPELCIFNFPRTAEGAVSYNAIEQLKDGLVFSSKYEGGVKMFNSPHILIFANWLPDVTTLSADRWKIINLADDGGFSL